MTEAEEQTQVFLQEAGELLVQVEEAVLDLEQSPEAREPLHRLFRAFHTLKGAAGAVGLTNIASFGHDVESLLDHVRSERVAVSRPLVDLVLAAGDFTRQLLSEMTGGPLADVELRDRIAADLRTLTPAGLEAKSLAEVSNRVIFADDPALTDAEAATLSIDFAPGPRLFDQGVDPGAVIDELRALGPCSVDAVIDAVPALDTFDPSRCYLSWHMALRTEREVSAVRDVFLFVENDSHISIEVDAPPAAPPPVEAGATEPTKSPPSAAAGTENRGKTPGADPTVRVASSKLDRLIQLVGELVISQARVSQVARGAAVGELIDPLEALERLVADLRDSVLGVRMMPIGDTFGRFRRLVRDLSSELGKEVDFVTQGEETELDKTMLDQLADPLVHLVRNSLDHGFEPPDTRLQAGKARRGVLRLAAAHEGGHVVVTVGDDGRGLDANAIRKKALERGIIAPDAKLDTEELYQLIFAPGFSTAAQVSSVSGRGVGMDVVKRQVEALRGSVTLHSEPARGTTIRLTLPLTLAIIDGLLVEVGGERLIVPMTAVAENVELPRAARANRNGQDAIVLRGELVPYLRLAEQFGFPAGREAIQRVVIVNHGGARLGLLVDRIVGVHQTVIQSLGRLSEGLGVIAGATILGDGRVALILDLAGVVQLAAAKARAADRFSETRNQEAGDAA
jgi:two-component system chemotaxis sensor kinase CheA